MRAAAQDASPFARASSAASPRRTSPVARAGERASRPVSIASASGAHARIRRAFPSIATGRAVRALAEPSQAVG